ncbi:CD166 antigen homolog A isoform X1 [Megalops cyprinoides]|uniref:CD166 antigen homolog A isoform X1 n=1 Tax=Megalops cyprinoides TaxID=118141 RepID=UPI001863FFA8|nr:CD166 antigen homolog A isoform X1 [Megalops cyprinoides]
MHSTGFYIGAIITSAVLLQVNSLDSIIALYGETVEVPCNRGAPMPENLMFVKWKYNKAGGSGDLLTKSNGQEVAILAKDSYKDRVSISPNSSLLIADGTLADQNTFTCMVVVLGDVKEYPVNVTVQKRPLPPQIKDKALELENGKLTTLGECVAQDAHPPASITWSKNGEPLVHDGKTTLITSAVTQDPATRLSTTSSKLEYSAVKGDVGAQFVCTAKHVQGPDQESPPETFTIRYPTEKVTLQVVTKGPFKEGDNVTLKCKADGNPPPTSFNFHLKGQKVLVEDSDSYTLTDVTRDITGEYKCSVADDDSVEDAKNISVNFLDVSLSPSGSIVKNVGDRLELTVQKNASGEVKVSWTKDKRPLDKPPKFDKLTYSDSGSYVCEFSVAGIKQSRSFQLVVQGPPEIKRLSKELGEDGQHKVLTCEAEGSPQPSVQWSVNGTDEQSSYQDWKLTHKITVVPTANLTVTCTVSNELGMVFKTIDVFSLFEEEKKQEEGEGDDQAKLIVGIVVGLLLAAAVVGVVYWIYMKKSKQGSWKTGEKESGTSEESKKLEENNHKADV